MTRPPRFGRTRSWQRLARDARGLTTVEYSIVLCLIAALCVGTWAKFGDQLNQYLGQARVKIRDHLHESKKGAEP